MPSSPFICVLFYGFSLEYGSLTLILAKSRHPIATLAHTSIMHTHGENISLIISDNVWTMAELRWRDKPTSDIRKVVGPHIWSQQLPGGFRAVASWWQPGGSIFHHRELEGEKHGENYTVCNLNKSLRIYDLILAQHHWKKHNPVNGK